MAIAVLPSHVSVRPRVLHSQNARRSSISTAFRARSRPQAPSLAPRSSPCASLHQGGEHPYTSEQSDRCGRRALLQQAAAGLLWLPAAQALQQSPAHAAAAGVASPTDSAPAETEYEPFRGKAGFSFQRPSNKGWVTAFVSVSLAFHPHLCRCPGLQAICKTTSPPFAGPASV